LSSKFLSVKFFKRILLFFLVLFLAFGVYFYFSVFISEPEVLLEKVKNLSRQKGEGGLYYVGNNWIKQNQYGLYEMYVEGSDFERGYVNGFLSQELVRKQEEIFVAKLEDMLPGKVYQKFLLAVVGWMNRNLDQHVDAEYLREIYGVSRSASSDFDFIAPKYQRILNYHAAHDIGHAMQNMNLVACTSVGLWGGRTADSSLFIGRNFDFYMGEEFAKDKIILFQNPDSGYKFLSVTWGGFTGIVSGMNEKGLTVTLNAAKTGIPGSAKTPVSIIARKILQYSSTIEEAYQIAKSYESFVAESFMIGSKNDNKVALIEKSPENTTLYEVTDNLLTCSNHFQGKEWLEDELNIENVNESPTEQRRERLMELIQPVSRMNHQTMSAILRDRYGLGGKDLGMGNEKAMNQFVAHHSVMFQPQKGLVWISAFPYQLGAYVAYDLNKIFSEKKGLKKNEDITEPQLLVQPDSFLYSKQYQDLLYFKATTNKLRKIIWDETGELSEIEIIKYKESNPRYFHTYMMLGDYYRVKQNRQEAILCYQKALTLDIPRLHDKEAITERLSKLQEEK
jgi:isopenicillin-N N-acyltransferase like protein